MQLIRKFALLAWVLVTATGLAEVVDLSAEQDHARLLSVLGIEALRPGVNGWDPQAAHPANFDESKATVYPNLPDPLKLENGEAVTTAEMWWSQRRPEIAEYFSKEIYGRVPEAVPAVEWEVVATEEIEVAQQSAEKRILRGRLNNSTCRELEVAIDLTIVLPAERSGAVPVILHFGWPPEILARFPPPPGPTWQEQVLARGWAAATIIPTSFQADNGAGLTRGVIGLSNRGQPRDLDDWGALRAWAWGASRALDYFETDPDIDAGRVGLEGLSRYGKAVLVAMAYDERFSLVLVGSSGAGGAKLLRRSFGETVENLAGTGQYHWMAGNFLKYAGPLQWNDLPVDAHQLIALCAPRPVFIGAGSLEQEGGWIDQRGMFLAAVAATPVYELLGASGVTTTAMPPLEEGLLSGELAWRQHAGGHTNMPNYPAFLDWAARFWKKD